ncbi:uncharacterized protein (TIGR00255 family) [Sinobacterium caligoides]|uniref:Uncharacterized protein (TIGR00255 family) n=1 Tax=Sinobacterium caligoides TaxID=933926 RepID=A0A3N2DI77_9GAMM|nr:YicC/YloC family endoribonuclease [Sinobacterium caligoides]ROR99094.1 uncharacterized protein (TIGR00255 family) [Sinobacterium caligoides]
MSKNHSPIKSMTAFSRQQGDYSWGQLTWELRSVNQRYLEPSFKLPEALRSLEPLIRESLRKHLARGKVECALRFQLHNERQQLNVNNQLASELLTAVTQLQQLDETLSPPNALDVLRWPGVLGEREFDDAQIQSDASALFEQAICQLTDSRIREGEAMKQVILDRLDSITHITVEVRGKMDGILLAQHNKLLERLEEMLSELDHDRIAQEMVHLAQKADVAEELDRLDTHIAEVRRVLHKGGPCGRRLDFLMQELNREANTLSSKSIVSKTTQAAVELKVLIEQMREQIQNIE